MKPVFSLIMIWLKDFMSYHLSPSFLILRQNQQTTSKRCRSKPKTSKPVRSENANDGVSNREFD